MNNIKKILSVLLVLAMLCSMAACSPKNPEATGGEPTGDSGSGSYRVSVQTAGGMPLAGIAVYVYADSSKEDMKGYGETDENGVATFDLPRSSDYVVELSGVVKGYEVADHYSFTGNTAAITLKSSLVEGENLSNVSLGLGDVMYDFSVQTSEGETIKLSEVLAEKKMVMLNFWYTTCSWCVKEFPYMEQAYQLYKDDIEIIALNSYQPDNEAAVEAFKQQMNLSMPMAKCPAAWANTFGVTGYPTSVVIDRYGVICLIEAGGIPSQGPFNNIFDYFTAEKYEQKLFPKGLEDLVVPVKPTYTMDSSENIGALINSGDIQVTYRPETESSNADMAWPFIADQKLGLDCIKASNQNIDSSFAVIYADITLKKGQAIGFDYLCSSEAGADGLHVIVNGEAIFQISGASEKEEWSHCFPWVAEEDGVYELALVYVKDSSDAEGDDTVYIRNMRVADVSEIDTETCLPALPANSKDGMNYEYADVVYNEKDGYYHVGSVNGPLLLADLLRPTQFNEEKSVSDLLYDGDVTVNGQNIYDAYVKFFSYASNSALEGYCTVTRELAEMLKIVAEQAGFEESENEWLKLCKYYKVYGAGDKQMEDPIKGLAPFSAYEATLGKNVATNCFSYDRILMPRGKLAKFVPTTSGVYRITSRTDTPTSVEGWIMDENRELLYTYEHNERLYEDDDSVSIVYYMEAGKAYYIDIAFWDLYEAGTIYYDIEYVGKTADIFTLASPGYFTYETDESGEAVYTTIAGGIKAVLGADGYYYHDLGKDSNGKQIYGSMIYADFIGITGLFDKPVTDMINMNGFDFTKSENDLYVLAVLNAQGGDVEAALKVLKDRWAEDYDNNAEEYKLNEVLAGIYHGKGEDLTKEIQTYLSKVIKSGPAELQGCVKVDARLAEILQMLMDKYTFEGIEFSWLKMCYYYNHLGPQA